MSISLFEKIVTAENEGKVWDFNHEHPDAIARCKSTLGWIVINHILSQSMNQLESERTVGLLTSFLSRRCLVCWFFYCDDPRPLSIANQLRLYWLNPLPNPHEVRDSWLVEILPTERGVPIVDCRWADTRSSSSSVANCARFARSRSWIDPIACFSDAGVAFSESPVSTGISEHSRWITEYAVPCAMEGRQMLFEEEFALIESPIPEIMYDREI